MVMKVPADAACVPTGVTYTITGTPALSIAPVISWLASSSPPGVSSSMSTAASPSSAASSMPRTT
jgi:hypothetical protein